MKTTDIIIKPIKGYSKQEAFEKIDINFKPDSIPGANCTNSWNLAGRPLYGTNEFKQFCVEQLLKKTKCSPGLGCYIMIDKSKRDKRTKPYKLYKPKNAGGIKKYILQHTIYEVILDTTSNSKIPEIISINNPIVSFNTLGDAKKAIKELTSETKKDYIIQTSKIPKNSVEIISKYTPSINAKLGTYIVFGVNLKNE